jgi:hypothetical protein
MLVVAKPFLPDGVIAVEWLLTIPIFGWAVFAWRPFAGPDRDELKWFHVRARFRSWRAVMRPWEIVYDWLITTLLLTAFVGVIFLGGLGGQPEKDHGKYFDDTHGVLTRISVTTYNRERRREIDLFSAFPALFLLVALHGYVNARNQHGRTSPMTSLGGADSLEVRS